MNDDLKSRRKIRARNPAPTLEDVARYAGVSTMTVSRVINDAPTVRESNRKLVLDAIEVLGYIPNQAARSLAGASQIQITMLYEEPSTYIAEFLFGSLEQARKHNVQFAVEKCNDYSRLDADIRRILDTDVDGLLVAPPLSDSYEVLSLVEESGKLAVAVTSSNAKIHVPTVRIDGYKAARDMTNHLVSLGHTQIGFISGDPSHAASQFRLDGYRDALTGNGIEINHDWIAQGMFTYRSGLEAAEKILDRENRPTAIFASNDDMAAAAIAVAHRFGLDVPGDLSLAGFDDTSLATRIWPQLTTIHVPTAEESRAAVDYLVRIIRAARAGERIETGDLVLDYTLVRRHSDAPPRLRALGNAHRQ